MIIAYLFFSFSLAAMNNQMPIKEGSGYKQQVGNNYASHNPSTAMNHLLLGKKPLVNSKPRRGPHPGAIPPEVRKTSNHSTSRSSVNKTASVPLLIPKEVDHHSFDNDTLSQNSNSSSIIELGSSIQESQKSESMSVTHVACPQVRNISYIITITW